MSIRYRVIFDGGSKGNPGNAYGSYLIEHGESVTVGPKRVDLGRGTSNEAEYRCLIAALEELDALLRREAVRPAQVALEIRGDSLLVLRQVEGAWKVKEPRLRALHEAARELLDAYREVSFRHHPRWQSVRRLGH